ncbi:MAG: SRPBCC family protein [Myxococcales bacterium]|nr:SRPBCC family protein [Myxococcales bacterium]MCB9753216.1 SRPBCC family protein [Myxococcales bacterium]
MKKVLKFVLGLVLVLVLGFFAAGLVIPTLSYETSVEVERPVETAWRVFMDGERMSQWMTNLQRVETIAGEPGMVGSQFRLVFDENGEEVVVSEMVTEVRKHEVYAFTIESDSVGGNAAVRFEDLGMRTRVTIRNELQGQNPVWQSLIVISQGFMRDRQLEQLNKLKQLIESADDV